MEKTFAFRLSQLAFSCCLLFIFLSPAVYADSDTEQQIKVSFIYNFAKFVTWPNLSNANAPLLICVSGSQPLSASISLLQGKKVGSHTIQVNALGKNKTMTECNMLFVSESEMPQLQEILAPLAGQPVLTVSTIAGFTQAGGMIGMKELDNRLRFDINLIAAKKANVSIASQLLQLADEVIQ